MRQVYETSLNYGDSRVISWELSSSAKKQLGCVQEIQEDRCEITILTDE